MRHSRNFEALDGVRFDRLVVFNGVSFLFWLTIGKRRSRFQRGDVVLSVDIDTYIDLFGGVVGD